MPFGQLVYRDLPAGVLHRRGARMFPGYAVVLDSCLTIFCMGMLLANLGSRLMLRRDSLLNIGPAVIAAIGLAVALLAGATPLLVATGFGIEVFV